LGGTRQLTLTPRRPNKLEIWHQMLSIASECPNLPSIVIYVRHFRIQTLRSASQRWSSHLSRKLSCLYRMSGDSRYWIIRRESLVSRSHSRYEPDGSIRQGRAIEPDRLDPNAKSNSCALSVCLRYPRFSHDLNNGKRTTKKLWFGSPLHDPALRLTAAWQDDQACYAKPHALRGFSQGGRSAGSFSAA
jgi:hypothetical protein